MRSETKPLRLNEQNFDSEILRSGEPSLVDFWADWCAPCHVVAPVIDQLASEFAGTARVGKVDIDESPSLAQRFSIHSVPALLFFREGREVDRITGVAPRSAVAEKLRALAPEPAAGRPT